MTAYLADTSAVVHLLRGTADPGWAALLAAGQVGICPPVEVELGATARTVSDYETLHTGLRAAYTWWPVPDSGWATVAAFQRDLVRIGHHRGSSLADLLIAATALHADVPVLHLDLDFEAIRKVSRLSTRRVDQPPPIQGPRTRSV